MSAFHKDCFACILKKMRECSHAGQEGGIMNRTVANKALYRLKSTWEKLHTSGISSLPMSDCKEHLQNDVAVAEVLWKIVNILMAPIKKLDLRAKPLAADLLRLAYYFTERHRTVLRKCQSISRQILCDYQMLSKYGFRQLLVTAYDAQFPGRLDKRIFCDDKQDIVWFAIRDGKEQLLSVLLSHGVMFLRPTHCNKRDLCQFNRSNSCIDGHLRRQYISFSLEDFLESFVPRIGWPLHRLIIVLRVILLLSFEVCENPEFGNRRRSTSCSVYFRCLRRAFATIPEPFVTSRELRDVFRVTCDYSDEGTEPRINKAIAKFEKLYPEGAGPYAPRTLKHLSRCQVRENLRQAWMLPRGARHLGLTDYIGRYIALKVM